MLPEHRAPHPAVVVLYWTGGLVTLNLHHGDMPRVHVHVVAAPKAGWEVAGICHGTGRLAQLYILDMIHEDSSSCHTWYMLITPLLLLQARQCLKTQQPMGDIPAH